MKRIFLFLATNLAILLVLGVVLNITYSVLGIDRSGMGGLLVFAAVFGFGGSIISLLISKWMALRTTGAEVISNPKNEAEQWLLDTVARQANAAGIGMPQVAVYASSEVNAFATGANRNNALVAVSSGLLEAMSLDEAEAVLAHEITHIANGDMITLTLIQGVVNTFVIFLSRIIASVIDSFVKSRSDDGKGMGVIAYMACVFVLEMLLGILASIIVMWFSRKREFRADEGGAALAGKKKMVAALRRLQQGPEPQMDGALAAFGINGKHSISELFLSHPPLEKRIEALEQHR